MKFVAFLRGINVGGKSTVSMALLKDAFIKAGFENVSTYINSGNVIFTSEEKDGPKLEKQIEILLERTFFPIRAVVVSEQTLYSVIEQIPLMWTKDDVRKYIAFLKYPTTPEDILREVQPKDGIDYIDSGPEVVYLTTRMEGLTKSSFPKLITKKISQDMTMRNFNTVQKLLTLMHKKD